MFGDLQIQSLARQIARLERIGDIVEVDDSKPLHAGDLVQIVVAGNNPPIKSFRQLDKLLIDRLALEVFPLDLQNLHIGMFAGLQLLQDFKSTSATRAAHFVVTVGHVLHFVQDEFGNDDLGIENAGFDNVGNASVDERAAVENQRLPTFQLFGKLDIRNHKTEIVPRLHQQ